MTFWFKTAQDMRYIKESIDLSIRFKAVMVDDVLKIVDLLLTDNDPIVVCESDGDTIFSIPEWTMIEVADMPLSIMSAVTYGELVSVNHV